MTPTENHSIERPAMLTRRRILSLLTMTGASLLATGGTSQALWNFFDSYPTASTDSLKRLNISKEWQAALGPMLPSYVGFLQSLKLKYIKVDQLIEPHTHVRNGVHNTLPPKAMWRNISSTLKVVDALAFRLELPVNELVSIYRSPAYNSRCPGAKSNSYHMRNNATDVRFTCPPGKVAAMARAMRGAGLYQGGVGRYSSFTHIDTRGKNADW